jgi:hypothetical protein
MRLLNGMRIVQYNKSLIVGYHKSALSVIESAVYAHDAEKKWIQSHPSILYEMEALKSAMSKLNSIFCSEDDSNPLFCYDALTEEGKNLSLYAPLLTEEAYKLHERNELFTEAAVSLLNANNLFEGNLVTKNGTVMIKRDFPILLLADEDILYLMKCFCKDSLGYEYFSRNSRRTAVWKSEAEFRALFQERIGDDTKNIKILENDFENLINFCQTKTGAPIVNDKILEVLSTEESSARKAKDNEEIDQEKFDDIIKDIVTHRHWVNIFLEIAKSLNIENEFLIVFQKKFTSSFKANLGDIPVLFPNLKDCVVPLKNVVDVLKPSADRKSNFFHLFYKPIGTTDESRKKDIVNRIAETLVIGINY